jgi:hypothetical protein
LGRVCGGVSRLGQDNKTAATGKAANGGNGPTGRSRMTAVQGKDRDMGSALRSVYQQTVEEPVPDDLLDLLGKLG